SPPPPPFLPGKTPPAPPRAPRPCKPPRRSSSRCPGIRDRRHDLAVQGGDRRRLQGGGGAPPRRDPFALRSTCRAAGGTRRADQDIRPCRRLSGGDAPCRIFRGRGAALLRRSTKILRHHRAKLSGALAGGRGRAALSRSIRQACRALTH